jgi:hypothetical protein
MGLNSMGGDLSRLLVDIIIRSIGCTGGWLDGKTYDYAWFKKREDSHFKIGPKIDNPEVLGNDVYACVDAAGFFCVRTPLEKAADKGVSESSSRAVTKIVNPYDVKSPPLRWNETKSAYRILGDRV